MTARGFFCVLERLGDLRISRAERRGTNREDAEDVWHDTTLVAWNAHIAGLLQTDVDIARWTAKVFRNLLNKHNRSARHHSVSLCDPVILDRRPLLRTAIDARDVEEVLARMPSEEADLLRWRFIEESNVATVARRLGVSKRELFRRQEIAKRRFHDVWTKYYMN